MNPTHRWSSRAHDVVADARYALRHFRRTPLATTTMLAVLALGIGTSVVLFTLINSLATQPGPGIAKDRALVRIRGTLRPAPAAGLQPRLLSWPEVEALAARSDVFSSVVAHANEAAMVKTADGGASEFAAGVVYATPNYFSTLGVRPASGSPPAGDRDVTRLSTAPSALISHAMWQRYFGGAPDVVGRVIRVNGIPTQVVGVAPPRFVGTGGSGAFTLWMPLGAYTIVQGRAADVFVNSDALFLSAVARLATGVSHDAGSVTANAVAQRSAVHADSSGARPQRGADVVPLLAGNSRVSEEADLVLSQALASGFALLVLLITCTNVSALMVGLAVARRSEIGVRLSLGADRRRLIRQLLTESVMLSFAAASVGLLVTALGIEFLGNRLEDVQLVIDWRVTLATSGTALVAGLLFGMSPALHATRVSLADAIRASSAAAGTPRSRMQRGLVIAQVALTQPLLVGLGVVIMNVAGQVQGRSSTATSHIVEIELDPWGGRVDDAQRESRIAAAVTRVATLPGVRAAMPMQMGTVHAPLVVYPADRIAGVTTDQVLQAVLTSAPRGYFGAMGVSVVRGRDFSAGDYAQAHHDAMRPPMFDAVVIGQGLARRLWGNADPIGRRLVLAASSAPPMTVVGVVGDPDASRVSDRVRLYVPYSTANTGVIAWTVGVALPLVNGIRQVVAAEAPLMPVVRAQTMEQREAFERRTVIRTSGLAAAGGVMALILSAIGLYAVISFSVTSRTREIGVRAALGAPNWIVARMFFVRGLGLGALGLALGLPLSIIAAQSLATSLRWPVPDTALLIACIGSAVLVVASLASWLPARRAAAVDPVQALRSE